MDLKSTPYVLQPYSGCTLEKYYFVHESSTAGYNAGHGSEKLQYAIGLLKQKNIEIDLEELKARINAAIRQMEIAEQKTEQN